MICRLYWCTCNRWEHSCLCSHSSTLAWICMTLCSHVIILSCSPAWKIAGSQIDISPALFTSNILYLPLYNLSSHRRDHMRCIHYNRIFCGWYGNLIYIFLKIQYILHYFSPCYNFSSYLRIYVWISGWDRIQHCITRDPDPATPCYSFGLIWRTCCQFKLDACLF